MGGLSEILGSQDGYAFVGRGSGLSILKSAVALPTGRLSKETVLSMCGGSSVMIALSTST